MTWIIFDYGNVLCLPQTDADVEAMAMAFGADPAAFKRAYWDHRLEFDRGSVSPAEYWSAALGRQVTGAELDTLIRMDVASWAYPDAGSVAVTRQLLEEGCQVALLSNAPACVADGLDELPWIAAIERRFYSGRMGLVKPDLEIYETVVRELGARPEQCVFVDDRLENIEAAERAGLSGVHYTDATALREALPDLR